VAVPGVVRHPVARIPRTLLPVVTWLAASCAPAATPAEAFQRGQDAAIPLADALGWCEGAADAADRCVVGAVRAHPGADAEACARVHDTRLRAECHFSRAESRARAGDRWGAVEACARAAGYHDECLYHAWSLELQHVAETHPDTPGAWGALQEPLAWWGGIQTIGPEPARVLTHDAWYFLGVVAQARGTPLGWSTCEALAPADRAGCREGIASYVARAAREGLRRAPEDVRDPLCRRIETEAAAALSARGALGVAWADAPGLETIFQESLRAGCQEPDGPRPWNPVFQPRRRMPT
jgi:hypothetical protein